MLLKAVVFPGEVQGRKRTADAISLVIVVDMYRTQAIMKRGLPRAS